MLPRRKLTEILHDDDRRELEKAWSESEAAKDLLPLPKGDYIARIIDGRTDTARTGTAGYKLKFRVLEGAHAGRLFWHDVWLTALALPMTKRDLGKLGIKSLEQLEKPLPHGIRCRVKLALRREEDGTEYNRVRSFEVIGIDPPDEPDAFAPAAPPETPDGAPPLNGAASHTPANAEGQAEDEASFPFGFNAPAGTGRGTP